MGNPLPTSGLDLLCAVPNFTAIPAVIAQPAYSVYIIQPGLTQDSVLPQTFGHNLVTSLGMTLLWSLILDPDATNSIATKASIFPLGCLLQTEPGQNNWELSKNKGAGQVRRANKFGNFFSGHRPRLLTQILQESKGISPPKKKEMTDLSIPYPSESGYTWQIGVWSLEQQSKVGEVHQAFPLYWRHYELAPVKAT